MSQIDKTSKAAIKVTRSASNRDDHLRNHGSLRTPAGWRLAPAFDMNLARAAHQHGLSLDGRTSGQRVTIAFATHRLYALSEREAKQILAEVVEAAWEWKAVAEEAGIGAVEREVVGQAFTVLDDATALGGA
jgi:serine/threonine-protein kinase HipA